MKKITWSIMFAPALLILLALITQNCSGTSFMGGGSTKAKTNPATSGGNTGVGDNGVTTGNAGEVTGTTPGGDPVVPGSTTEDIPVPDPLKEKVGKLTDDEFNQTTLVKNFLTNKQDNFYVITTAGNVYYYAMEGATAPNIDDVKIVSKKMWSFVMGGAGGARSYVTEGGLVFARSGGRIFWIDPLKTPEGPLDMTIGGPNYYQIAGIDDNHRGCAVSYKIGEKRYVGMGYSLGHFAIFTQDDTPPYKPNWTTVDANYTIPVTSASGGWGYSCFIDQTKLIYYGQWTQGGTNAFNLTTKQAADVATTAPNPTRINLTEGSGSYAANGDRKGNVYNINGYYTFAGDINKTATWATLGGKIVTYPISCMENGTACDASFTYDATAQLNLSGGYLGPMSALPSTGVIVAQRSVGNIFFARLKDPKNLAAGIEVKNLAKVEGDPYMYNDFTGATLYSNNADLAYDLGENSGFDNASALSVLIISWQAKAGAATTWTDLKLEIRCYSEGDFPPNFSEVVNMKDAGLRTFVQAGSCRNKNADKVELKVTQLNDTETISRIESFKVNFYQGK